MRKNILKSAGSLLFLYSRAATLWILALRELNLHAVIPGDLLDSGALGAHDGPVELLRNHALHGHLSILGRGRKKERDFSSVCFELT